MRSRQSKTKKRKQSSKKSEEPPDVLYIGKTTQTFPIKIILVEENTILEQLVRIAIAKHDHSIHLHLRNQIRCNKERIASIDFNEIASLKEKEGRVEQLIKDIILLRKTPPSVVTENLIRQKRHALKGLKEKMISGKTIDFIVRKRLKKRGFFSST